jgi:hypothetical protein
MGLGCGEMKGPDKNMKSNPLPAAAAILTACILLSAVHETHLAPVSVYINGYQYW